MAIAKLWDMPRNQGDPRQAPKSGRIIKFQAEKKHVCVEADELPIEHVRSKPLTGWRKTAHEQKQKLFGPKKIGSVIPQPIERCDPIVPTKPTFHVKCASTGVKIVGGRLWPCECGKPATFKFKIRDYATEAQIEERHSYT